MREQLTEAVNANGGLWYLSEPVFISGWAQPMASFAPSWGGFYEVTWEEVERAYQGDKVIRAARRVSNRWLGLRKAPAMETHDRPLYDCCHL